MVLSNGAAVSAARFCSPRVEPEVAFLLREPLRGPDVTVDDVRAATEAVAVALEIVDSRIADWKLTLPDTVADNASSGAVVLGEWVPYSADIDLAAARASLWLNRTEIDSGVGAAVMGDPAVAVAWLANALAPFGTQILSGQFVMSGSFTSAAFVHPGYDGLHHHQRPGHRVADASLRKNHDHATISGRWPSSARATSAPT